MERPQAVSPSDLDALAVLAAERDSLRTALQEAERACPCKHVTPCHDRCTCVTPLSSSGCRRCCKYGSNDQRRSAATRIAAAIALASQNGDEP